MSGDVLAARRAELGLDRPIPVQYAAWMQQVLQGNLGASVATGRPVLDIISQRVGPTVTLMGIAMLVSLAIAIPIGVMSAIRANSFIDHFATLIAYLGVPVPTFFSGLAFICMFAVTLQLLPRGLMEPPGSGVRMVDRLNHFVLAVAVLGFQVAAIYTR